MYVEPPLRSEAGLPARNVARLPGFLEPLLIARGLLPAIVRRAGADQVHVGAEVLQAGIVGPDAKILRPELFQPPFSPPCSWASHRSSSTTSTCRSRPTSGP